MSILDFTKPDFWRVKTVEVEPKRKLIHQTLTVFFDDGTNNKWEYYPGGGGVDFSQFEQWFITQPDYATYMMSTPHETVGFKKGAISRFLIENTFEGDE